MIIILAIVAAVFVVPDAWRLPVIGLAVVLEIAETLFWMRLSGRARARAGPETMIGELATVVTHCDPLGEVRIHGELWRARCRVPAQVGERVRVRELDGLTLVVEPEALSDQ